MSVTYTWKVTGIKTTSVANTADVVVQTYWEKTGTDENGNSGTFNGATPFAVNSSFATSNNFISFDKLTENTVISWIQAVVVNEYENHVNTRIQELINDAINPVKDTSLPWANVTSNVATSNT